MSNTFTKNYVDGAALTEAKLDTAYQSLQLDIANTALTTTGSSDGQVLTSQGSGIAAAFETIPDPQGLFSLRNYALSASASTGTLIVALKTKALANPSGSDVVNFNYSTNGTLSATYNTVNVTASVSLTLPASATLGAQNTSAQKVFVYGYYNTGAASVKLALSLRPDFDKGSYVSASTLSSSADTGSSLYASASLSIVPRLLGYVTSAITAAGAWQSPTKVAITNNYDSPLESGRLQSISTATAQVGQIVRSANCGALNIVGTDSGTLATIVTNMDLRLTTTGRPVMFGLSSASNPSNSSFIEKTDANALIIFIYRNDTTLVANYNVKGASTAYGANFGGVDQPPAGLTRYTVRACVVSGTGSIVDYNLYAVEL